MGGKAPCRSNSIWIFNIKIFLQKKRTGLPKSRFSSDAMPPTRHSAVVAPDDGFVRDRSREHSRHPARQVDRPVVAPPGHCQRPFAGHLRPPLSRVDSVVARLPAPPLVSSRTAPKAAALRRRTPRG